MGLEKVTEGGGDGSVGEDVELENREEMAASLESVEEEEDVTSDSSSEEELFSCVRSLSHKDRFCKDCSTLNVLHCDES
jgi:hypothetical protein